MGLCEQRKTKLTAKILGTCESPKIEMFIIDGGGRRRSTFYEHVHIGTFFTGIPFRPTKVFKTFISDEFPFGRMALRKEMPT